MKKMITFLVLFVMLVSFIPAGAVAPEAANQSKLKNGVYIVQMIDPPVVAYEGTIKGYPSTTPAKGQKIDPFSSKVVNYVSYLDARHNDALNAVGGGRKLYDYRYAYNGFAAEMSPVQADKMKQVAGVLAVSIDEAQRPDTSSTPNFLGLTDTDGLWDQLGGAGSAGEGIIIGDLDTGIWPEHPSFSDRTGLNGNATQDGKLDYQQIPGWHGKCTPGEDFPASDCNQKLIGAQYFNAGWAASDILPEDYLSARDWDGHGTHTASTAAGNNSVTATGPAAVFGAVSGIAPRARIAAYKVCWLTAGGVLCTGADRVAAIDQAVADGVDVLNHSIGATLTNFLDPVQVAFLFAARAGVFVAASAGNSGPTISTVASPGPWITTVAAATHNRNGNGSVTLGNSATYSGASVATLVGPAPLIDSFAAGLAGANPTEVELCYPGTLDPTLVAGKIVVCKRGVIARVDKSLAVGQAGGVGMILYNSPDSSLNADFHFVPTVHVSQADGLAIKLYAATPGAAATATINQATIIYNAPAPFTASFSSRGPSLAANGDILKPDITAPGVDILAGVSPVGNERLFDLLSGTSMSSPHVAGLAALLKDLHPDWTPMMIKSALMTSAYDVLDGPNTNPLVIFRQGAGHVRPNSAADPGLVYNAGWNDWLAFLCGTTTGVGASTCTALTGLGYSTDPSNLNVASIAIGDLAGVQTVTRKVTNVGSQAETFTASYTGLIGITVALPGTLTVAKGASQAFNVTFTTATAALNSYAGGQFTLTGNKGHVVRIPVVVRPVALATPTQVSGSYNVTFGYTGAFTATARGLIPAVLTSGTVADDPTDGDCLLTTPNAQKVPVVVPAGTTYARFSLFDADVNPGSDIDLCVFNSGGTRVGISGSGTSAEEINLLVPAAGTYTVVVQGWGVVGSSPFKLHTWLLDSTAAGNMTVSAPATATIGGTGAVNLTFSGLTTGTKYLGSVVYGGAAGMPNPTIVRVDP